MGMLIHIHVHIQAQSAPLLAKAIYAEAKAKKAYGASHTALKKARRNHAYAIQEKNDLKIALQKAIQKAKQRYAAASKAVDAALLDVKAKEVVDAKANEELHLAQRAVKRERAAADTSAGLEFKKR